MLQLAPEASLFVAEDALVVRVGARWSRVRPKSSSEARALLELLRREGRVPADGADAATVRALVELGALRPLPRVVVVDLLGCADVLSLASYSRCERAEDLEVPPTVPTVVLSSRYHPALEGVLSVLTGRDAVVAFTSSRSVVVARGDAGAQGGCARCAWLGDVQQVGAVPPVRAPGIPVSGAEQWLSRRAAQLVDQVFSDLVHISSGQALVEMLGGERTVLPISRHPACSCWRGAEAVSDAAWDELAERRFAPVWPVERGGTETRPSARVVLRRSRKGHVVSSATLGVALGSGPDREIRALAEAIERSSMHHAPPTVSATSGQKLGTDAWNPETIRALLYRPEERAAEGFRYADYDVESPIDWSLARALGHSREALVPAALVGHVENDASRLIGATSNGYACHRDRVAVEAAALLELIERDAILLGWIFERPWARLADVSGDRDVYLCTQDIDLPVVLACACLDDGSMRCGSAAATSLDAAIDRALEELDVAIAGRSSAHKRPSLQRVDTPHGPEDHVAHVSGAVGHEVRRRLRERSTSEQRSSVDRWIPRHADPREAIQVALEKAGLEAWIVDRSMPAVFGAGWHVVRALIPGIVELSFGLGYRRLASSRVTRALAAGESLNPAPHPLG